MVMTLISTPHLQQRKQGFKWVPSKKFISMFPSRGGMLNVNSLNLVFTLSSKEKTDFYLNPFLVALPLPNRKLLLLAILMKIQARGQQTEMDLNEFLQQMEILKDNSQAEVSQVGARRNWKLSLNYAFRLQQFGKLW